jgi:hypothetical protein
MYLGVTGITDWDSHVERVVDVVFYETLFRAFLIERTLATPDTPANLHRVHVR